MSTDLPETEKSPQKWWLPIVEFFIHAIVGTVLFILIALPAIGINLFILHLEIKLSLSPILYLSLTMVEYMIVASDLILFAVFMFKSIKRTVSLL